MDIEFRTIERSNWMQCTQLEVNDEQKNFVASNSFSLAQASYEPDTYPFAIYRNGEMVGFIMYDFDSDFGVWEMCRLMVDKKHQKQGIGKAAVEKLLKHVTAKHGHIMFYTSAEPTNANAIRTYEKAGFKLNGNIVYGEAQLQIQL